VRNAAGKLANRLQLLRVPQHFLCLAAFGAFDFQLPVGLGQRARSIGDRNLQTLIQPAQRLFRAAHP